MRTVFYILLFTVVFAASNHPLSAAGPKFLTEDHLKCKPCTQVYAPFDVTVAQLVKMLKKSKAKEIKVRDNEGSTVAMPLVSCNDGYNEYAFQFSVDSVLFGVKIIQHFKSSVEAEAQHLNMCKLASVNYGEKKIKNSTNQSFTYECDTINYLTSLRVEVRGADVIQTFMFFKRE